MKKKLKAKPQVSAPVEKMKNWGKSVKNKDDGTYITCGGCGHKSLMPEAKRDYEWAGCHMCGNTLYGDFSKRIRHD